MPDPFRRLHTRYPCDLPVSVSSFATEARIAEGRFVNISAGGAQLGIRHPLERKLPYLFRLLGRPSAMVLPGRVVWNAPRDPHDPQSHRYGIQFNLTSTQEARLRAFVAALRRDAERPPEQDFLKGYWDR